MIEVHNLCEKLPKEERFQLIDQARRSSSSVPDNIAEGYASYHYKDKINRFYDARKESAETQNHILKMERKGYIKNGISQIPIAQSPNNLKLIIKPFCICILIILNLWQLSYGQQDNLEVKGKIEAQSLTIKGGVGQSSFPKAPVKGEVFYLSDESTYYTFDGSQWWSIGGTTGGDKTVATKIVAAFNSDLSGGKTADYICDGIDDQQQINQAINSLPASGGVVYLLEGRYWISSVLLEGETLKGIVPHSNTSIIGAGIGTQIIVIGTPPLYAINALSVNNVFISGLIIDGINFNTVTNSKVDKVYIQSATDYCIGLDNSSNNIISNSNLYPFSLTSGIKLGNHSNNNIISGNNIQTNTGEGIGIFTSSNNNVISGNIVSNCMFSGINIGSSNNTISKNNIQNNLSGISLFDSANNNTISGNNTQNNYWVGIALGRNSSNNIISNNNIQENKYKGIDIYESSNNNTISGNVLYENGQTVSDAISIHSSNKNIISYNRIYDSTRRGSGTEYGINISDNASNSNYLVGNYIDGAAFSAPINDAGVNTKFTDKVKLTLEPSSGYTGLVSGGTLTPTGPTSYLRLNPTGAVTLGNPAIADGKSPGDLLILENTSTNSITLNDNTNVQLESSSIILSQNDILTLLWDGSDWVEIGYADN